MNISEIMDLYGIKQAAAYKWKKALSNLGLEITRENLDKIKSQEINLTHALSGSTVETVENTVETIENSIVPIENTVEITVENNVETSSVPAANSGFGLSIGRLQELNSEAELEVLVKSKLKEFHESKLQSQRSQELKSKISEVQKVDPKELGKMLDLLGVA